jgi:aminoglycoside 2''-phosphotransferase
MNLGPKKALILQAAPSLDIDKIQAIDKGWDNFVCTVNDDYIFRFPRRQTSAESLELEQTVLPVIAPQLNVQIPQFKFMTGSARDYQTMCVGYPKIDGQEFTQDVYSKLKAAGRLDHIIKQIGEFLTTLHSFPQSEACQLGVQKKGGRVAWKNYYQQIKTKLYARLSQTQTKQIDKFFADYLNQPAQYDFKPVLTHGDFGDIHILVNADKGSVEGIIDFGDMALADPAQDFVGLYSFSPTFLKQILQEYQLSVNDQFMMRVLFYYRLIPFHVMLGAINLDKPEEFDRGKKMLDQRID